MKNIDWKLLREQKNDLHSVLCNYIEILSENEITSLTGILHLIDSIQDHAVDVEGKSSQEIFG